MEIDVPIPVPTVDEIIETLRRSALPTLLVEGTSDAFVYRLIERRFSLEGGTVLCCGGRDSLLAVYRRRKEFAHLRRAFLADRDMWLFSGIPSGLEDIVFTSGYSIENDVLEGESIDRLMDKAEQAEYRLLIGEVCRWFAFEVQEFLAGREPLLDIHVNRIVPLGTVRLSECWCDERRFAEPDKHLFEALHLAYKMKLRGKQLLQTLTRILSATTRSSKYSRQNIVEIAATSPEHKRLQELCNAICLSLGILAAHKAVEAGEPAAGASS